MFTKNSFMKFGLWLVGAFVFQTVCAIWVFKGNYQSVDNELEMGVNGERNSRMNNIVNGNVILGTIDEPMQKKIEEIRVMAREARDRERLEREENGLDGNESDFEDDEEEGFGKSGIEKEVNERLNKLKEKLEKNRDKIPKRLENLKGDSVMEGKEKNGLASNLGNEALIFKKRYKYKGSFSNEMDRPKGFSVPSEKDHNKVEENSLNSENEVSGSDLADGSNILDDDLRLKLDIPDSNMRNISNDTERRRQGRNIDVAEHKPPKVQDRNNDGPVAVTSDSRDPSILKASEVTNYQNRTSSGNSLGGRQQLKQSGSSKKPHTGSEWWEKLPYVLVILMQQGDDGDKVRGLYTLKSGSGGESELSHIVAFQDRGDATNFCYLLQLYFEDLGDFSIDVIPLSMKVRSLSNSHELKEAMKSNTKRVIVVKKGQLQLFAGQPISDVEMALRSLMEQD
ncbi:hypothetical protein Leryth_024804 [Lithospermum erythrorhizon]|nr:hypothetical protein Leryth_024804 [Lithospermum erythrorhizon]